MIRTAFVQDLINNMFLMVVKHSMIRTIRIVSKVLALFLRGVKFSIFRTQSVYEGRSVGS